MPFPTFSPLCKEQSVPLLTYEEEEDFRRFPLQSMNQKSANSRIRYAKQFDTVLETGNAQSLLQLSPEERLHVTKSLACLSKFLGCHNTTWVSLKRKYNLKWSSGKVSLRYSNALMVMIPRVWIQCCNGSDKCRKSFHCHIATYFCFVP